MVSEVCMGHPSTAIIDYEKQDTQHKQWLDEARADRDDTISIDDQSNFIEETIPFTGTIAEHFLFYVSWE